MLQGCLSALRAQVWSNFPGGAAYQIAIRTAKRKHLRIAARKKRELENKLKAKEKVVEKTYVPYKIRLMQAAGPKVRLDDLLAERFKDLPEDDVWLQKYYMKRVCPFAEAVQFHREAFHPTVLNAPDSPLFLDIELNMRKEKTKFAEKVSGIVLLPHMDDNKVKRSVVACCQSPEDQAKAKEAGAEFVGSYEVVNAIEKGDLKVDDVAHFVCHTDFIMDLLKLRGVLAKKFPDKKKGTLGTDIASMVRTLARGIEFESRKDFGVFLYANLNFEVGRLSMPDQHLLENAQAIFQAVAPLKSPEYGEFIVKCLVKVPGSNEEFVLDYKPFIPKVEVVRKSKKKGKPAAATVQAPAVDGETGQNVVVEPEEQKVAVSA